MQLYFNNHQVVCWLYTLQSNNGEVFVPGTYFEVLRQDGYKVNLGEIDLQRPSWVGRTICGVNIK